VSSTATLLTTIFPNREKLEEIYITQIDKDG